MRERLDLDSFANLTMHEARQRVESLPVFKEFLAPVIEPAVSGGATLGLCTSLVWLHYLNRINRSDSRQGLPRARFTTPA